MDTNIPVGAIVQTELNQWQVRPFDPERDSEGKGLPVTCLTSALPFHTQLLANEIKGIVSLPEPEPAAEVIVNLTLNIPASRGELVAARDYLDQIIQGLESDAEATVVPRSNKEVLEEAAASLSTVSFYYQGGNDEHPRERRIEMHDTDDTHVYGHLCDNGEYRGFRLDRIVGDVEIEDD